MSTDGKKRSGKVVLPAMKQTAKQIAKVMHAHLEDGKGGTEELLILQVKHNYVVDPARRSVDHHIDPFLDRLSKRRLQARSLRERWGAQRARVWATVQNEMINRFSKQIIQDRLRDLKRLEKLQTFYYDLVHPKADQDGNLILDDEGNPTWKVQPKSLGEAVQSFKTMYILAEAARRNVMNVIEPMAPQIVDAQVAEEGSYFSQDELGEFARALLEKRNLQLDEESMPLEGDEEDDEDYEEDPD